MTIQDQQRFSELLPFLRLNDFFNTLDPDLFVALETELEIIELPKGTTLFHAGDPGDAMFVIVRGVLEVSVPQSEGPALRLDMLDPGSMVGETALLTGRPRSATVSAVVDSEVISLSKSGFDRLAQGHPGLIESLSAHILPRIRRSQLAMVLTQLFGPLETQVMQSIQRNVTWRHLSAGEVLVHKGETGDSMFIVINGRLYIVNDAKTGSDQIIGDVVRGETVGEFALLTGEPRSATVFAVRDSDLVCLTQANLNELMDVYPKIVLQMTRSIIRRTQAQLAHRLGASAPNIVLALIPASPGLPSPKFIENLVAELSIFGKTVYLDSQRFDEQFGLAGAAQQPDGHPTSTVINSWLTEVEQSNSCLILGADRTFTEWTRRCLRQADRVVLVAAAADVTDPDLFSSLMDLTMKAPLLQNAPDLILIQPEGATRPAYASRWLSRLRLRTLHHVRMGEKRDFSRLARRLTGRAVGLVLSGGGARGFAHVGVIQALEEAGYEIDLIGGTSMGALIGAAYAMDWDTAHMREMARALSSPGKLLDYTLPFTSLVASYKVNKILKDLFGEVQIEDLWRKYFCISTNLSRAEPVIHQMGSLWEAVRASIAIPGIFVPLLRTGEVLVDGGVMNNFPVDVMRQYCEGGYVIGVNTTLKKEIAHNFQFNPALSGWDVLWSKINPLAPKIHAPSILSSMMRATEASSVYHNSLNPSLPDLLIMPPVETYGTLDFSEYENIIQEGYRSALPEISRLKNELQGSRQKPVSQAGVAEAVHDDVGR
jgi:predicted acylesterase/phospholipase RssA/CRP-like cAMP-binding protein